MGFNSGFKGLTKFTVWLVRNSGPG